LTATPPRGIPLWRDLELDAEPSIELADYKIGASGSGIHDVRDARTRALVPLVVKAYRRRPRPAVDRMWGELSAGGNCEGPDRTARLAFVPLLDIVRGPPGSATRRAADAYYAMPRATLSLAQLLTSLTGRRPAMVTGQTAEQMLRRLPEDLLHEVGVLARRNLMHGDLLPENVLWLRNGAVDEAYRLLGRRRPSCSGPDAAFAEDDAAWVLSDFDQAVDLSLPLPPSYDYTGDQLVPEPWSGLPEAWVDSESAASLLRYVLNTLEEASGKLPDLAGLAAALRPSYAAAISAAHTLSMSLGQPPDPKDIIWGARDSKRARRLSPERDA